jgi:methionyl aminopeptidase
MIYLKSESEIEKMRESTQIVSQTLGEVSNYIKPGVSTAKLDEVAEDYIRSKNGNPAFKGFGPENNPFPATLCISVNDEVVHGIPDEKRILKEGDIVTVDCGVEKDGYFGDHAYTFAVGECGEDVLKLLRITEESLEKGIQQAVHGNRIGDISYAIQTHCEKEGYGVVRNLVGHGIGKAMHEDPTVPNFGRPGRGERLRSGMVLAIEPMITMGSHNVITKGDGWTVVTADNNLAAHFEHNVVIRKRKAEILSTFDYINEVVKN